MIREHNDIGGALSGEDHYVRTEIMDSMRELDQQMHHMLTAG